MKPETHAKRIQARGKAMHKGLIKTALSAACAIAPLAIAVPVGSASAQTVRPAQDIVLSIGRGELVTVPGSMADVFVANNSIADVQVKSQRQLYVFGLSGGETTIYASNSAGDIVWSANIRVGSNIDSIDQMLALAMPEAKVNVATMGSNTVLLTGTVVAPEDAAEAERLVSAFVGEDVNVVSRFRMATPLQVNLRVRFAEVSRSLSRNLGMNLTSIDSTGGFQFGIGQGRTGFVEGGMLDALGVGNIPTGLIPDPNNPGQFIDATGTSITPSSPGTTLGGLGKFLGLDLAGALDLGEREGLVTTLSEPNLTALSGETAEFLAGGEFPIPLSQGLGTTTIEYKKYGVSLSYTPTVLSNGRISMRVRPEVSEISSQNSITIEGFNVPSLTTRRAETTIELGSGQSFMIAGLLSNTSQNAIDKAPGLGDLPVLGNLFRSTSYQRGETELVIVVTPYLVKPVNDSEIRLPTDGLSATSAAQQFFFAQEVDGQAMPERPMPQAAEPATGTPGISRSDQSGAPLAANQSNAAAARPGFSLK